MRHRLRAIGETRFDPDVALMRSERSAGGHFVVEETCEYADLLFEAAAGAAGPAIPHEPPPAWWSAEPDDVGAADRYMANRVVRAIVSGQDPDPGSATYGNFRWHRFDPVVRDLNGGVFLAHGLARLARVRAGLLEEPTATALEAALPRLVRALRRRAVPWRYTNIHLMTIGGLMQLGRLLGDDAAVEDAARRFDDWVAGTSAEGFHEWGCPTYTPLAFAGLEAAWDAAPADADLRDRLARALHLMTAVVAAHVLPNGTVGGAAARAYPRDVTGRSLTTLLAHVKLGTELGSGTLERCGLLGANLTLYHYLPPPSLLRHPGGAAWEVRERTGAVRRLHHGRGGLSLASQSLRMPIGHPAPPAVFAARDGLADSATVSLLACEPQQRSAVEVEVEQRAFTALALLSARDELRAGAPSRTPRVLVHGLVSAGELWLDGARWDGRPRRGAGAVRLVLDLEGAHVGIVVAPGDAEDPAWRLERDGEAVVLELGPLDGSAAALVHVDPEDAPSADGYAAWLTAWEVSVGDGRAEAAHGASGERIATGAVEAEAEHEPLFADDRFTLQPGDFAAIVDGRAPLPEPRS